jgi:hypothetical protein
MTNLDSRLFALDLNRATTLLFPSPEQAVKKYKLDQIGKRR